MEISSALLSLLPSKRKTSPSGWISLNAPCCHHRGHSPDTRQRGGILLTANGGFTFHCFNCNFKAGWSSGKLLSNNTKQLFRWAGMSETDIGRLGLLTLKFRDNSVNTIKKLNFELELKELPEQADLLLNWVNHSDPDIQRQAIKAVEYLQNRGIDLSWYAWYWTPEPGYNDRVIIPFYNNDQIVGWTARKIGEGKPKYLTSSQPGYVFNIDQQQKNFNRKYVIVVEGQFDAIAIDGVAIMHNQPNETQAARITALNREVIVVPDRDAAGAKMIKSALDNGWGISIPPWEHDIKDVADAVARYGRLYTLLTILHYRETNSIKIQLQHKKLSNVK